MAEDRDLRGLGEWLAERGMRTSVYGAQFLLEALYRVGLGDAGHGLLTSREQFSWLHMMDDLGATIVMEAWDPSVKPNTTFSHALGSTPANIVPKYVAGVRLLGAGAREVLVAPQPGPLSWLRSKVPTVRGPVEVALDRRDGFSLVVDLPPNVGGRIELDLGQLGIADPGSLHLRSEGRAPAAPSGAAGSSSQRSSPAARWWPPTTAADGASTGAIPST